MRYVHCIQSWLPGCSTRHHSRSCQARFWQLFFIFSIFLHDFDEHSPSGVSLTPAIFTFGIRLDDSSKSKPIPPKWLLTRREASSLVASTAFLPGSPFVHSLQPHPSDLLWQQSPSTLDSDDDTVDLNLVEGLKKEQWEGTHMKVRSLDASVADSQRNGASSWPMARWPDPVLRRAATPVPQKYFHDPRLNMVLVKACQLLAETAELAGAAGVAAEQCAVDARIVHLQQATDILGAGGVSLVGWPALAHPITMVNPRIVARSPETEMRSWREHCLVLPSTWEATTLRDAWVDVEYQPANGGGSWTRIRLSGEPSRAIQHELDHDRGILITDHVLLEELQDATMRRIESPGHLERMKIAYGRRIDESMLVR
jgi:peptide deformylase